MKLAVILDPLPTLKIYKDSSYAIMLEAQLRGHEVYVLQQQELYFRDAQVIAKAQALSIAPEGKPWFKLAPHVDRVLNQFDIVLMRKDPPLDLQYLYTTHLLDLAERSGARVFNRPQALRELNEKLAILNFPEFIAPTLVSSQSGLIRAFLEEHQDIILKPLDGMGGSGIFRVKKNEQNFNVIVESLTQIGTRAIMAQRYIPEIARGDKRILMIAGRPVPYVLARIPQHGDPRGNLAAGGKGVVQALSARDWEIAGRLGPYLQQAGVFLAGLDVIGDYLTEINVTSPTCLQEISQASECNVAAMVLQALEAEIGVKTRPA